MTDKDRTETIRSSRLLLRPWRQEDLEPLFAMSNDARVMEFFPSFHTRDDCEAMLTRLINHHREHGFGYWAVEIPGYYHLRWFARTGGAAFSMRPLLPCVENWLAAHGRTLGSRLCHRRRAGSSSIWIRTIGASRDHLNDCGDQHSITASYAKAWDDM